MPSEPGTTGTPAAFMIWRALTLSPILSMTSGGGPMKTMPSSLQRWAKAAFSAKKP